MRPFVVTRTPLLERPEGRVVTVKNYRIVWEDEAKAREIELFVEYSLEAGLVQIENIRPTQITFYNAESKTAERTIRIYTDVARQMLTKQYLASRDESLTLAEEIQQQLDLLDDAVEATVA